MSNGSDFLKETRLALVLFLLIVGAVVITPVLFD